MKKLYEILNQRLAKGCVGIEIEIEGNDFPEEVDARWNAVHDGSLRGDNREYVFKKPLPVGECKPALKALAKDLKDAGTELNFSFRTSVHIHVNCQELTYPQYLNFLYTYFLLEEPLMTFCGKERKGNRFCLRLQDAEGMLDTYQRLFSQWDEGFGNIPADQVRYSAMNIEATTKFGSLEFRGMQGCLDINRIDTWLNALVYLREFAKSCANPTEVYEKYSELEAQGFMDHVLKEYSPQFYYARAVRDIQQSFSLSIDLPFAYGQAAKRYAPPAPKMMINPPDFQARLDALMGEEVGNPFRGNLFAPAPQQAVMPRPAVRPAAPRAPAVRRRPANQF